MQKTFIVGYGVGYSMSPIINVGDKIFIQKVKKGINIGDIIVFYQQEILIGHRVIYKTKKNLIVKGDNVSYFDRPLRYKEILGKVSQIQGKYGFINLETPLSKIVSWYLLFHSVAICYLPFKVYVLLRKVLRGRRILVKLLTKIS